MRQSFIQTLRNPIALVGVALTTAAGLVFVFLVVAQSVGLLDNPYAGLVVYVMAPTLFVLGLVLIPIGLLIERRRVRHGRPLPVWPRFDLNDPGIRRAAIIVLAATGINIGIISMASYSAVQYTESDSFCGQVCHTVMQPEFSAHQVGAHGRIRCVQCHVGEGAQGFVDAKLSGTRQLSLVLSGNYSMPIPTPIRNFPGVQGSCEGCHRPDRFVGDVIRTIYDHADDAENTQTVTTLRLHVGGPIGGTRTGLGIHWHMNRGNQVEYVALDEKREQIPYMKVSTPDGLVREYFAEGVTAADVADKPRRRMDCLDCHSRPAHRFADSPEREVDAALGAGEISRAIPFVRREAVRVLKEAYPSHEVALRSIQSSMRDALAPGLSGPSAGADLGQAIAVTQAIYQANVFPEMKVTWGSYANQLGHVTSTGCFRCHDESHKTADGTVLSQDCDLCHTIE